MRTHRLQPGSLQIRTSLCVGAFLVAAGVYMYFVSVSIVQVVLQEEAEHTASELRSEIAQLEREYIAAQHVISERIAAEQGLVAVGEKVFLNRDTGSLVLAPEAE